MPREDFTELRVAQIMRWWPATIWVFIDYQLYCVGCPIGNFHTLTEAAEAHGIPLDRLAAELETVIAAGTLTDNLPQLRRRPTAGDAHP